MNYKLMQRPMFRLGGTARKNYQTGTDLSDIEKLIKERGEARQRSISGIKSILPLQVLAGTPSLTQIRGPRDIVNVLSEIGTSPETFGALGKLASLDMTAKDKDLADRIALAKIRKDAEGSSTRLKSEKAIRRIDKTIRKLETEKERLDPNNPNYEAEVNRINKDIAAEKSAKRAFYTDDTRKEAYKILKSSIKFANIEPSEEDIQKAMKSLTGNAMGGTPINRAGFQEGTPDPTLPQEKPVEAVDDRKLENIMQAAPALENPGEVRDMAFDDPKNVYESLRRRLPREITDDIVRLITYNQEAFADFADISDQTDVDSFNQKYNVQLVIPVEEVS